MESNVARAIRMSEADTVAILVEDAKRGAAIVWDGKERGVHAAQDIPFGHKVAVKAMGAGDPVIKYGERMGIAKRAIAEGEHVHVHNVRGLNTEERSVAVRG